jgi:hypothetical protein
MIINILTRTSERPKEFERLYKSIKSQKNNTLKYRHIVCYENDSDLEYIKKYDDITAFRVNRKEIYEKYRDMGYHLNVNDPNCFIHNLYINELMDKIEEGYIIIIDDDDILYSDETFNDIEYIINDIDEDTIAFVQMVHPNTRRIPSDGRIDKKEIFKGDIGSPCIIFHSKYSKEIRWGGWRAEDFKFLTEINKISKKQKWYHKRIVQVLESGNQYEKLKKL